MQNIINRAAGTMVIVAIATLSFAAAPAVHAADMDIGGYYDGSYDTGSYDTGSYYDGSYDNGSYDTGSYYDGSYPTDTGSYYDGSYANSTPSYSTGGYSTGGYSTGGYSTGGYSVGGGYSTGGGYRVGTPVVYNPAPVVTTPSNTTNNTCTNNSCNSDDHSVVNIQNPAPVINNNNVVANYAQPVATQTQYCANGYSGVYPNCYRAQPVVYQQPPVAYNTATPYVSLSQVPYTGLELGFWGSIAYWGAFVLFALFAAYLIAIKRVQNNIAAYLKSVLFGTDEVEVETVTTDTDAPAAPAPAPVAVATTNGDVIDSFIMSQINRARA